MRTKGSPHVPLFRETSGRNRMLSYCRQNFTSVAEAADFFDTSQSFLSHWIHHRREASDDMLEHWAQMSGIPLRVLLDDRFTSRKLAKELNITPA